MILRPFRHVPILTQSENWALWSLALVNGEPNHKFQSSPSPKTGRYDRIIGVGLVRRSNPHPVRKLGAILPATPPQEQINGSNPHPVRKLGAIIIINGMHCGSVLVPILTQSENWALFGSPISFSIGQSFQSSPSPKTGRYTNKYLIAAIGRPVPILTQSENWALY